MERALVAPTLMHPFLSPHPSAAAWRDAASQAALERRALEQVAEAQGQGRALASPKKFVFALQGQPDLALLMGCLGAWRAAAAERRRLRQQVMRAYRHLYLTLARRCFGILR